jgi:hypothetical protein
MKSPTERLALSKRTIDIWDAHGGPGVGRIDEAIRMMHEECAILAELAAAHPEHAEAAGELGARYGALANALRLRAN